AFPRNFLHNSWYPNVMWALGNSEVPFTPVFAKGGTYTGNGTFQSISIPAPASFILIRNTGANSFYIWFGASLGGHPTADGGIRPDFLRTDFDLTTGATT